MYIRYIERLAQRRPLAARNSVQPRRAACCAAWDSQPGRQRTGSKWNDSSVKEKEGRAVRSRGVDTRPRAVVQGFVGGGGLGPGAARRR